MFKTSAECSLELISATRAHKIIHFPDGDCDAWYSHDFMPCSAARVSFGNEDKTGQDIEKDRKLMKYLAEHQHMTPFEYQHATFMIECPLFIRSQIHRHRTFSYNEISRRYTDENLEFWKPGTWRYQSTSNKQASDGEFLAPALDKEYELACQAALRTYETLLNYGAAREMARSVLPQSVLTKFYMGGNLRNWKHFIDLRRDAHAQHEVQVIANRIAEALRKLWPESCAALSI